MAAIWAFEEEAHGWKIERQPKRVRRLVGESCAKEVLAGLTKEGTLATKYGSGTESRTL
jgi:hypothetical protein